MVADFLIAHFGVSTSNYAIYREALRHKSAYTVRKGLPSNERLEFLGDAMLEGVVSDYLYHKYQDGDEGVLTKLRARIVSRKNLNKVATEIGLPEVISKSSRIKSANSSIGGNALEAIVGAIYLDKGYAKTKTVISDKLLDEMMSIEELEQREENFKSVLLEWCQKDGIELAYETAETKLNTHSFVSKVLVNHEEVSSGKGRNKKAAEQDAAEEAIKKLKIEI